METSDPKLESIVQFANENPEGVSLAQIVAHVNGHERTVQHWLADLVNSHRLKSKGKGRATRYVVPKSRPATAGEVSPTPAGTAPIAETPAPQSGQNAGQSAAAAPACSPATARQPTGAVPSPVATPIGQSAATGPYAPPSITGQILTKNPVAAPATHRQPATMAPATAGASVDNDEPPADAPFARYPEFEELYYHIFPRIVRARLRRTAAESIVREQADFDYHTDPRRQQAFIAAAMAKLDALTVADVHPYGVGPCTYDEWRRVWNAPPKSAW